MSPVELMAFILVVFLFIKVGVVCMNPQKWLNFSKKLYANATMLTVVSAVLAAVTGYYLFQELTIVQVFASMFFLSFIMMIGIAPFSKDLMAFAEQLMTGNILKRAWLSTTIWVVLGLWVLKELFA